MSIENEDYRSNLGARLKASRKEAGISQTGLASMTGMARDTISRYERGDLVPSAEVLTKILMALDSVSGEELDAKWLLSGYGRPSETGNKIVVDGIGLLNSLNFTRGGSADISLGGGDMARLLKGCLASIERHENPNELAKEALNDLIEYFHSANDGDVELIARAFIANKSVRLTPSKEVLLPLDMQEHTDSSDAENERSNSVTQTFNGAVSQVGGGNINNFGDKKK